jgi:hypothetical protein
LVNADFTVGGHIWFNALKWCMWELIGAQEIMNIQWKYWLE